MNRRTFLGSIALGFLMASTPSIAMGWLGTQRRSRKLFAQSRRTDSISFYVALNGKDSWSGKLPAPNEDGTDGPFATLEASRNAIRQLKKQSGSLRQPVRVEVREGTYFLERTFSLDDEDSGSEDSPVTYTTYNNEKPILSGGRLIQGWQEEEVNGKTMWTVSLPEVKAGKWYFQQLWVNGKRRKRARYPNEGYLKVEAVPDAGKNWMQGQNNFVFKQGDLPNWASGNRGGEVVVLTRWIESRLPIAKIEKSSRSLQFSKKSVFRVEVGNLYYLDNIFEALDKPGEWYLDKEKGKLYYLPMSGENIETAEAIAPKLTFITLLRGTPKAKKYVEYVNFENLTFSHTDWQLPPQVSGYLQNALGVPAAIFGVGAKYCTWKNCAIARVGTHAIELFRGCQNNTITGCNMYDLGAGGIKIGERVTNVPKITNSEEANRNQVIKNHIYDGGHFFPSAVAVRTVQSNYNRIAQNHIHDFPYMGISVRGNFGYARTRAHHNIVEFNYVHHIGKLSNGEQPILNDKGAIYVLGLQPGTVIRSNIVHDVDGAQTWAWGIYLDAGSSEILIENNLIYRAAGGAFHLNYGRANIIRNNIFAFGKFAEFRRSKAEKQLSFRVENNIFYWDEGKLLDGEWQDFKFKFDRNLYWRQGKEIDFNGLSWSEWQAKGMDKNSRIADPLFINPEAGNFRLRSDSPAYKLGFKELQSLPYYFYIRS